ncbi:MAG: Mth938-like domain-containing protein [Rhodospirillaceae bacterium]
MQSYGGGRFRIAGEVHEGSVLVALEATLAWPVADASAIAVDNLEPVLGDGGILVIGCGPTFRAPPPELRAALKARGVSLEWMDTGAACRTFNVLLTEERAAVAALIAVD